MIAPLPSAGPAMRVLMTADTIGGVWTYSLQLASALAAYGVEVVLATEGPRMSDAQRRASERLGLRVYESDYRLEWMSGAWDEVEGGGEWLRQLAGQVKPDVMHINGYAHGAVSFGVPKLVAAHSCVYSWFGAVRGSEPPAEWRRYHDAAARGIAGADVVVAPSRAMMHEIERFYGRPARTRVIYNGRDPGVFAPGAKEALIFSAGRFWDEGKNLRALDAVASSLMWRVCVAGPGARDFQNVRSLGLLSEEDVARWVARAGIYALPARYEPFGLSVLEAGLAGCALVLGDIASLREVWGDAAEFVHPEDHAALTAALGRLTRDDARRRRMAERAREQAMRYTHTRMAQEYLEVYGQLAQLRGPAAAPRTSRRSPAAWGAD